MKYKICFLILFFLINLFSRSNPELINLNIKIQDSIKSGTEKRTYTSYVENRVHRAGLFWLNVSNTGWFGEPWTGAVDPCTGKTAPGGELPGGSGIDYLSRLYGSAVTLNLHQ